MKLFFLIVKQISLFTSSTDKLNFRLVRVLYYIQRFNFIIRHKSNRLHLVLNALFKLSIRNKIKEQSKNEEFDVLFTIFLIQITSKFEDKLIRKYFTDST